MEFLRKPQSLFSWFLFVGTLKVKESVLPIKVPNIPMLLSPVRPLFGVLIYDLNNTNDQRIGHSIEEFFLPDLKRTVLQLS